MIQFIYFALLVSIVDANWEDNGEICFGAKDNSFGKFTVQETGKLHAVELVHKRGYLSCIGLNIQNKIYPSRWGCTYPNFVNYVGTYITNNKDAIIFPTQKSARFHHGGNWAEVKGMNCNSTALGYSNWLNPVRVVKGDELRIWYGEDLRNSGESNNNGRSCATVRTLIE